MASECLSTRKSQGGFSVSDLDVLIADDVDKQTVITMHNQDCDEDGLYQGKKRKEVNYLDVLVDRVIYYLDDDYMSECYETNKKFYDEFTKMVLMLSTMVGKNLILLI